MGEAPPSTSCLFCPKSIVITFFSNYNKGYKVVITGDFMRDTKNELLQVRLSELEKQVIRDKADILGLSVADYVRECCIFSNVTAEFMRKLHATSIQARTENV